MSAHRYVELRAERAKLETSRKLVSVLGGVTIDNVTLKKYVSCLVLTEENACS